MEWQILYIQVGITLLLFCCFIILYRQASRPSMNWPAFMRLTNQEFILACQESNPNQRWIKLSLLQSKVETHLTWNKDKDSYLQMHFDVESFLSNLQNRLQDTTKQIKELQTNST